MTATTEPPGSEGYPWLLNDLLRSLQPATPIGWHVKFSMQPFGSEYVMVGKCSCGDFTTRAGGPRAWEDVTLLTGIHVQSVHLKLQA